MSNREFKGLVAAHPGTIKGIARVIPNPENLSDFERVEWGDVLITTMTHPQHESAMYRAGAIVTQSGGITSHPAIVAREWGKVALVQVKEALSIPDGATVEVESPESGTGIVRVLA